MNNKIIQLKEYGSNLGPRVIGLEIKNKILKMLKMQESDVVTIDLEQIEIMSSGFAKELFGELYANLGSNFKEKIKIKLPANNATIFRSTIMRGIETCVKI